MIKEILVTTKDETQGRSTKAPMITRPMVFERSFVKQRFHMSNADFLKMQKRKSGVCFYDHSRLCELLNYSLSPRECGKLGQPSAKDGRDSSYY